MKRGNALPAASDPSGAPSTQERGYAVEGDDFDSVEVDNARIIDLQLDQRFQWRKLAG